MNIRDPQKFLENIWDWTPYNECFSPTKIRITDIDGAVERNGCFLFIETKLPGESLPLGQRIMYDALANSPLVNVLIVWGKPNRPEAYQLWPKEKRAGGFSAVFRIIQQWFQYANRQRSKPPILLYVQEAQREFAELTPPHWYGVTIPIVTLGDEEKLIA
jgi:hypothetical protein